MRPELALQQLQNILRFGVGLGQYRQACLLQHPGSGQFGGFRGEIRVLNPGAGCRQVFCGLVQVGNGGLEAVLARTQVSPDAVDFANGIVDGDQGQIRAFAGADVDVVQGYIVIGCDTCDGWQIVESAIPVRVQADGDTKVGALLRREIDLCVGGIQISRDAGIGCLGIDLGQHILQGSGILYVDFRSVDVSGECDALSLCKLVGESFSSRDTFRGIKSVGTIGKREYN